MRKLLTNQEQIDMVEALLGGHVGIKCTGGKCAWVKYYRQRLAMLKRERKRLDKLDEMIELERVRT